MNSPRPIALPLTVLLIAGGLCAQDSKPSGQVLRFSFAKGLKGHYAMATQADMKIDANGQKMNTKMNMDMFMSFEVTDVVDGRAHINHTLDRMKMTGNMPMVGAIEFDTADEDSVPAMFDQYVDMIGQTIVTKVDERGTFEAELPQGISSASAAQTGFNDKMFSQIMPQLPEGPIAVGETWTTSMAMPMGQMGDMKMNVINKLAAADGNMITIERTLEVDLEGLAQMPVKPNFRKAESVIVLDLRNAMPEQSSTEMEMDMNMDQGGRTMTMDMKMRNTLRRVTAEEAQGPVEKSEKPEKPTSQKSDK